MWSRIDDKLRTHPKVYQAGAILGENGRVLAIGFFVMALSWSNEHLTDGYLSDAAIEGLTSDALNAKRMAKALNSAGLFERNENGYYIHDFADWNKQARDIKRKRESDRRRKSRHRQQLANA